MLSVHLGILSILNYRGAKTNLTLNENLNKTTINEFKSSEGHHVYEKAWSEMKYKKYAVLTSMSFGQRGQRNVLQRKQLTTRIKD
jgi:hypothetical protein